MVGEAHSFAIGEVPNSPFTAQVVEVTSQIQPDGRSVALGTPSLLGLAARDSHGRVVARTRTVTTTQEPESDLQLWTEIICDPAQGTITTVAYRDSDRSSNLDVRIPSGTEPTASVRTQERSKTIAVFSVWHRVVEGRDNMGPETFEGLPAYRYRITRTREPRSVRDVVNSDEPFLQLAVTTWKAYPDTEDDVHLTEIHRNEPSPELFDIPSDIRVHVPPPRHQP
jgi:hypothetical protein